MPAKGPNMIWILLQINLSECRLLYVFQVLSLKFDRREHFDYSITELLINSDSLDLLNCINGLIGADVLCKKIKIFKNCENEWKTNGILLFWSLQRWHRKTPITRWPDIISKIGLFQKIQEIQISKFILEAILTI